MMKLAFDAHKKTSTCGYLCPSTGELVKEKIPTKFEALRELLERYAEPVIVYVEACREGPRFARWAQSLGAEVHLLDPAKIKPIARVMQAKTDKRDARLMALLTLADGLLNLEVYLAPDNVTQNRALSRGRNVLRKISTMLRNVLRIILHLNDVETGVTDLCGKRARQEWDGWIAQLPPRTALVARIFFDLLSQVEQSIGTLDAEMSKRAKLDPVVKALQEVHGVGRMIAFAIVAEIGDISRFRNPKALICFAGLAPMSNDSDEYHGQRHLSNRCNKRLRCVVVQAAQCAARCRKPSRAREAYYRVKQNHDPTTASIAAAREIITDVYYIWRRFNTAQVLGPVST